jgi:hypothetical protein
LLDTIAARAELVASSRKGDVHLMRPGSLVRALLAGALLIVVPACSSHRVEPASPVAPQDATVATQLVIDQFLRASNSNDLDTMARLFGTVDGSIRKWEKKDDVDKRMFAIASVLRHDSYTVKRQEIVPGRREQATRVIVSMRFPSQKTIDVPFTLVWTRDSVWLIEQIGITEITNRR